MSFYRRFVYLLLIEPLGIEIFEKLYRGKDLCILLIEPLGIEIEYPQAQQEQLLPFN